MPHPPGPPPAPPRPSAACSRLLLIGLWLVAVPGLTRAAGRPAPPADAPLAEPSPAAEQVDPRTLPILRWEPTFAPNSSHLLAPPLRARHLFAMGYPLASWELFLALFVSGIQYHLDTATNAPDWEYNFSWESQKEKLLLGKGFRFDDNAMVLNSPGHPTSGMLFYLASRASGLSVSQALLTTFVASLAWEVWWEYREVVGVNDLIVTTVCGLAFGEALWQLSELFAHAEDTTGHRWAAALLAGYASFDPFRPPREVGPRGPLDRHGLPRDVWHRIHLEAGAETTTPLPFQLGLAPMVEVRYALVNVPGYGEAGHRSRWIDHPTHTRFNLHLAIDRRGVSDFELLAQSDYLGWLGQAIDARGDGNEGISGDVGLGALYEHRTVLLPTFAAQRASAAIAGPSAHLLGVRGPWMVRLDAAVYPAFAMVTSVAMRTWTDANDPTVLASVMRNQGYSFGFAMVGISRAVVSFEQAELGITWKRYATWRITGLDRDRATHPDAHHATDDGDELAIGLLLPTGLEDLRVQLAARWLWLSGTLDQVRGSADDLQGSLGLVLAY